jgi:hypothetical protein
MYLIGSRGCCHLQSSDKSDWDVVLERPDEELPEWADNCSAMNTLDICQKYHCGFIETEKGRFKIISAIGHMLLKRSHLHRPFKFAKHIRDYHLLKQKFGFITDLCDDTEYYRLLDERIKLTKLEYPDRTPSLKKTTDDFFDDQVTKYYHHDDLHRITCYGEQPIFEMLKTDANKVWCSKQKWESLDHMTQVRCVAEECFVIALERYIIPKIETGQKHPPERFAYSWALERVCTTLTSGWFRDFAIENWPEISSLELNFLERFKDVRKSKTINKIK